MTEPAPGAGADPTNLKTTATKVDGGWKIEVSRPDESRAYLAQITLGGSFAALAPGETVLALIKARALTGSASLQNA